MNDLEEILLDEEIEEIEKRQSSASKFDFPAITLLINATGTSIYFNARALKYIPEYIKWGTTTEYVIGLPAKKTDTNAYGTRPHSYGKQAAFPSELRREKKLRPGHYKLYRYKDGFAFKRYEPLKEGE